PLLNLYLSRSPVIQGQEYAIFVSDPNVSSHSPYSVTATLDGAGVSLAQNGNDFWAFLGPTPGLMESHDFHVTISQGGSVVGTQDLTFSVAHATNDPNYPNVTSVTPTLIAPVGGTSVLICGSNFTYGVQVMIGGVSAVTTLLDSNTLLAISPSLN